MDWIFGGSKQDDSTSQRDTSPSEEVVESSPVEDQIPDDDQKNCSKRVYVNEMPVGAEDGNHGWFSRTMSNLGVYHTNVSVETDEEVHTSGLGRQDNGPGGDMPIGVPTTSLEQTQRNQDEEAHGNLTKVPIEEYMGGKYKNVDPDVLEQNIRKQTEEHESQGLYGMPRLDAEGRPRLNICWTHTNDNLHDALPPEEQERLREESREKGERFEQHIFETT